MIDLKNYGYLPGELREKELGIPARITAVHKERYALVCEHGEGYARLKSGVYYNGTAEMYPTVGDFVRIEYNASGDSRILSTDSRRTFFFRRDPTPGRGEQAVAANFDTVFILQSLNYDFNLKRLERYLTMGWQSGAVPVVVLTKQDLADQWEERLYEAQTVAVGVDVFAISAKTGFGLEQLSVYLQPGKTIVFLGSSGVGKSSLVNALANKTIMEIREIREDDSKGRHTTTHRELFLLSGGTMVIDTPGMRELGMWDVSSGLGEAFTDVEQYFGQCRFSDCKHHTEPGCAVKSALENGSLSAERWDSYQQLKREAQFTEDKGAYLRGKQQRHKEIAKWIKQSKK